MLELPTNDVVPLVQLHWQVTIRLNPFGVGWIHDGLAGGTNGDWLGQIALTGLGDPGDLWREVSNMGLLSLESSLGDEDWEVAVLDAEFLDFAIEKVLDLFPDEVGRWTENVASRDVVVLNQLSLGDDLV